MTEALQRLRCARCGEYYWADQHHRCRSGGGLVLARPGRVRVGFDVAQARRMPGVPPSLPEPGGDGRSQPAVIESPALQRRLRALEAEIEVLKRTSDRLRGNDSQYEAALELLVAEVVELKDRLSQTDTASEPAGAAEGEESMVAEQRHRRRVRRPFPPRRHTAALMMWVFALAVVAAGVAGLVLVRMLG